MNCWPHGGLYRSIYDLQLRDQEEFAALDAQLREQADTEVAGSNGTHSGPQYSPAPWKKGETEMSNSNGSGTVAHSYRGKWTRFLPTK